MIEKTEGIPYVGAFISVTWGFLSLCIAGVLYIARAIPRLDGRIDTLQATVTAQKQDAERMNEWLSRVEEKLDRVLITRHKT